MLAGAGRGLFFIDAADGELLGALSATSVKLTGLPQNQTQAGTKVEEGQTGRRQNHKREEVKRGKQEGESDQSVLHTCMKMS